MCTARGTQNWVCYCMFNFIDNALSQVAVLIYFPTRNISGFPAPICSLMWASDCSDQLRWWVTGGINIWSALRIAFSVALSSHGCTNPRDSPPLPWACPRCLPAFPLGCCGFATHRTCMFVSHLPKLLEFLERRAMGASFVTIFGLWSWVPETTSSHQDQMCLFSLISPSHHDCV